MRALSLAAYEVTARLPARFPGARLLRARAAALVCQAVDPSANIHPGARLCRDLSIGPRSGVGQGSVFIGGASISIGRGVRMGPQCLFVTGDHNIPPPQQSFDTSGSRNRPIRIEDEVFIGARVTVLGGVTVGQGAVIGACAVVVRDVPPGAVVAGNPARVLRQRRVQ